MSFQSEIHNFISGVYLNPVLRDLGLAYNSDVSPQTLTIGRVAIKALTNTAIAAVALLPAMIVGGPVTVALGLTCVVAVGVISATKAYQDESTLCSRFFRACASL